MIKSANQYPVHALLSYEGNLMYKVPPYQREYSWHKVQWEELFQDLIEADGAHFMGTIITVNTTMDTVPGSVLELIDGQQRMTTLTLLLAAVYSVLKQHYDELDDDERTDVTLLGRQLVGKADGEPRVTPQVQGRNRDDYHTVLAEAGLKVAPIRTPYFPMRRVAKCFNYFRSSISKLAESEGLDPVKAALRVREAVEQDDVQVGSDSTPTGTPFKLTIWRANADWIDYLTQVTGHQPTWWNTPGDPPGAVDAQSVTVTRKAGKCSP